jgi:hypothetical protein
LLFAFTLTVPAFAHKPETCADSADLYSTDHLSIRVKLDAVKATDAWAEKEALKNLTKVLDLDWTIDNDPATCNVSLAYFREDSLRLAYVVQPRTAEFDGTIHINTNRHISSITMAEILEHETLHLLGLQHNRDPYSLMYWKMDSGETVWGLGLDAFDLQRLSKMHALRQTSSQRVMVPTESRNSS